MSDPARLHDEALVIDCHADTPQRFLDDDWDFTSADPAGGMISLPLARQGGLDAEFFAIWVEPFEHLPSTQPGSFSIRALQLIDSVHQQVNRHQDQLQLCLSADDICQAKLSGRFAVLLGLEGGHAIENSLALLRTYFRLGVRYMTLTWSNSNDWARSSGHHLAGTRALPTGLTDFGRQVIREMNRLGMIIDVSHVADSTLADVLATSSAPVIASHSSARAIADSPRNLTDDQLRAIASRGGATMVNFYPGFLSTRWRDAWEASRPARTSMQLEAAAPYIAAGLPVPFSVSNRIDRLFAAQIPRPPFADLIAHIQHIVAVTGPDHVGIGSDFDGIPALPEGIDSAADLPRITHALAGLGHPPETLRKLLGGNLLRVMRQVQAAAANPL